MNTMQTQAQTQALKQKEELPKIEEVQEGEAVEKHD